MDGGLEALTKGLEELGVSNRGPGVVARPFWSVGRGQKAHSESLDWL